MDTLPDLQQTDAKKRLVRAALQVFASKGYEGASTREICRLADVNVAGIHYYFGDKASLYREVFRIPEQIGPFPFEMADPNAPVRTALVAFYGHIMAYIAAPELQQLRLVVLREELQPSGVLDGQPDGPRRMHDDLTRFLCRAIGIREPDAALHHLAFSIGGLALVLFVAPHRRQPDRARIAGRRCGVARHHRTVGRSRSCTDRGGDEASRSGHRHEFCISNQIARCRESAQRQPSGEALMKVGRTVRGWLIGIAVAVVMAVGAAELRPKGVDPSAAPKTVAQPATALTVSVVHPEHVEWPEVIQASGTIAPWQEAIVGAEVAGLRLAELLVDVGDEVTKGQLLARFDDATTLAMVRQIRSGCRRSRSECRRSTKPTPNVPNASAKPAR